MAKPKPRFCQFRLRTLLMLPVLVAVLMGVWLGVLKPRLEFAARRQDSLKAVTWSGGTPEDQVRRARLEDALEAATYASTKTPTLLYVGVYPRTIVVDWISRDPSADGVGLVLHNGGPWSFALEMVEHSEDLLIFTAAVVSDENPQAWEEIQAAQGCRAFLTRDGSQASNEVEVRFPGR